VGLETVWFVLAAVMVTAYVVLDGFDLGAGILHFRVGRDERERARILRSIGPVWDGNEVWLLATGGVLVLAFPALYAESFSGFYLPLTLVLWLLIGRACSIELRHQIASPAWTPFWDRVFQVSSALLAVCFGAALGNVVRGVPFDEEGRFFEPLWTDMTRTTGATGVLDWYTVLVGVASLAALAMHGGAWLALKLDGEPQTRARAAIRRWWYAVVATTVLVTVATFSVQPHVPARLAAHPWLHAFPLLAAAGLAGTFAFVRRGRDRATFFATSVYLLGMLTSAAFGLYPYVLPSSTDPGRAMTVHGARAGETALRTGLWWWVPGIALAVAYQAWAYRRFRGKVGEEAGGYH
jgi:cytochrome d ubiquinol oxidase subunit II